MKGVHGPGCGHGNTHIAMAEADLQKSSRLDSVRQVFSLVMTDA